MDNRVPVGNYYPKYTTNNLIAKALVRNFLKNIDEIIAGINPSTLHEVGCGEGYIISRYQNGNRTLKGTDFSESTIQKANQLNEQNGWGVEFEVANLFSLDSESHSAELILCCEVLEHIKQPNKALEIINMLAKPYLIISVPREPIWRLLNMLRGKYVAKFGNTPGHINHWSKKDFLELISAKFEIIQVKSPPPWTIALCKIK